MHLYELFPEAKGTGKREEEISFVTRKADELTEENADKTLFFHIDPIGKSPALPTFRHFPKAIVSSNPGLFPGQNAFFSPNVRSDYAYAYRALCKDVPEKLIGITGTNGKSTTAVFLKAILESTKKKVGLIGTGRILSGDKELADSCYSMTTPDAEILYPALAKMKSDGCGACVMEVSSHALALERVSPLRFSVGVFTNLSPEHTDFHVSLEDYFMTKAKLFSQSDQAVIGIDSPYGQKLSSILSIPFFTFGFSLRADFRIKDFREVDDGSCFRLFYPSGNCFVKLKMPGAYNAENAAGAITAAFLCGIPPAVSAEAIENVTVPGRYVTYHSDITVISDYAHTPAAVENLLKTVKCRENGKITVVFGCGGCRDRAKRPQTAAIVAYYADRFILTDDNPRSEDPDRILQDILSGLASDSEYRIIRPRCLAIETAITEADPGDTVVFFGKSCERYELCAEGAMPYDEQNLIQNALKRRSCGHTESDEN